MEEEEEREEERRGGRQIEAPASLLTTIATTHCHTSAERTALLLFSCHKKPVQWEEARMQITVRVQLKWTHWQVFGAMFVQLFKNLTVLL